MIFRKFLMVLAIAFTCMMCLYSIAHINAYSYKGKIGTTLPDGILDIISDASLNA